MRIAQVAPLFESVPPQNYGGTERVVAYLTDALVDAGHDVVLFASGDSTTKAQLVAACPRALRTDSRCKDPIALHYALIEDVYRRSAEFDVIHFHIDYLHFSVSCREARPRVTTLHGRLDLDELVPLYRKFPMEPVVSISDAQRRPLPWINWQGTVYHGLPTGLHTLQPNPGQYLAFVGRISPEKRVDRAIEIAKRTEMPLKIAAKIDKADRDYFESEIKHLLDSALVEFVGEIGGEAKDEFLGNAYALLFPIDWPEPFGLVMIEAMACGLPIVAWRCGSVPEVIDEGVTGYVVESVDEAVRAVGQIPQLSRRRCREVFQTRFSADRMCRDYLDIYEKILDEEDDKRRMAARPAGKGLPAIGRESISRKPASRLPASRDSIRRHSSDPTRHPKPARG